MGVGILGLVATGRSRCITLTWNSEVGLEASLNSDHHHQLVASKLDGVDTACIVEHSEHEQRYLS